jgi:hypothetical protein
LAKAQKGSHKVEFFSNITLIRQRYNEGMVVAKLLYDELVTAGKITMPYQSFAKYLRIEIVGKPTISESAPKKESEPAAQNTRSTVTVQQPETESKNTTTKEPLILRGTNVAKTSFSPHTREIDEKDIL